jgi:hypothetical protein
MDWHDIRDREISTAQLGLFARWLDSDPEVPEGQWIFPLAQAVRTESNV